MARFLALLTLVGVLLAGPAMADVVHLENGKTIEGTVTERGDKILVETPYGTITLGKAEVARIERKGSVVAEYRARRANVAPDDVEGRFQLALWLKDRGATKKSREELTALLRLDPDHRGVHYALGHVRYEGRWMTETEAMEAQGYVRHEGRWITAEEKVLFEHDRGSRARIMAIQTQVTKLVQAMASPSKAVRKKMHRELVTLAREIESPELEKKANEVAAWYDRAYAALRQRALLEVRATMATLKRPIPTFTTSLGAFSVPVTLHLPEVAIVSIGTTVVVPAGR